MAGEVLNAAVTFSRAVQFDPSNPKGWENLGVALMQLAIHTHRESYMAHAGRALSEAVKSDHAAATVRENIASFQQNLLVQFPNMKCTNALVCPPRGETATTQTQTFSKPKTMRELTRKASLDSACSEDSIRVKVSSEERDAGVLGPHSFDQATAVFRTCGLVVLDNVYSTELVQKLARSQKKLFQKNAMAMKDDSTVTVRAGKTGRFNQKTPHAPPFVSDEYANNRILMSILHNAMGGLESRTVEVQTLSWVTSLAHSPAGNWHADFGALFPNNDENIEFLPWMPAHAVIAIVPLHNLTLKMGPTEFVLKSHIPCKQWELKPLQVAQNWQLEMCPHADKLFQATGSMGSAVLFDMRMMHRGMANNSPRKRNVLYTTYAQQWFTDSVNWNSKQTQSFDDHTPALRKLMTRLDSQHYTNMLEELLKERGVDVAALQSSYNFSKVSIGK